MLLKNRCPITFEEWNSLQPDYGEIIDANGTRWIVIQRVDINTYKMQPNDDSNGESIRFKYVNNAGTGVPGIIDKNRKRPDYFWDDSVKIVFN